MIEEQAYIIIFYAYSWRNEIMGSTRVARRAGTQHAARATAANANRDDNERQWIIGSDAVEQAGKLKSKRARSSG
jgi:hypothetical protein